LPALQTIQHYYRRTANERGYEIGSAQHRISLMAEELGELARALQTAHNLIPPEIPTDRQEALALADVFIHVVQMANILCLDLGRAVQNREILNIKKLLDI
jgi:NTP pyrophosphatase (non-canonical NTP hydrolase)